MNRKKMFIKIGVPSLVIVGLLICVYIFVVIGWDFLSTRSERRLWRKKTHEFVKTLDSNTTREKVLEYLSDSEWKKARVYEKDSMIIILTPMEFGAGNWIIELLFDSGKIKSVRVRTEDDPKFKLPPSDAPCDRFFDDLRK